MGTETKGFVLDIYYTALLWCEKQHTCNAMICIYITGSMHSTPTAALEVILMLPPLGIYIEGEARFFWKINSSKMWPFGGFRKDD
jgi:hypothetical protein